MTSDNHTNPEKETAREPDAWALRNNQGYWVGIWNDRRIAEDIKAKQFGRGDEIFPVYLGPPS